MTYQHNQALEQLRNIERAVVDGDLVSANEQARDLLPMLQASTVQEAATLQAKVDAIKASVRSSQAAIARRIQNSKQGRQGCHTYQTIQSHPS